MLRVGQLLLFSPVFWSMFNTCFFDDVIQEMKICINVLDIT